jgi:hypothetical protein
MYVKFARLLAARLFPAILVIVEFIPENYYIKKQE